MTAPRPWSGHRPLRAGLDAFAGLLLRDLRVLTRERGQFALRTISQPLLLVFVFTYVFPQIGQGLRGFQGEATFSDILAPGVLGIAVFIKGIQVVALPMVQEFGYTREIEDRVMAPLPVWGVGVAKVVTGAVQGILGAVIVLPIVILLPAEAPDLRIAWGHLVVLLPLAAAVASALGLALGTSVKPEQVPLMFSVVILPFTFLGATYYPWSELAAIPWLQWLTLLNPLVYMAEGFRLALTPQFPHMHPLAIYGALLGLILVLGWIGLRGLRRRVIG